MSKQFLHNSAGVIDIPVSNEKIIKSNLWKQRNRNDISDLMSIKNKMTGKQPTVTFNLNDDTRIRQHLPRKGAFQQEKQFLLLLLQILVRLECCCKSQAIVYVVVVNRTCVASMWLRYWLHYQFKSSIQCDSMEKILCKSLYCRCQFPNFVWCMFWCLLSTFSITHQANNALKLNLSGLCQLI